MNSQKAGTKIESSVSEDVANGRPRSGKWTKEEAAYVDLLISEFRQGALPLREGTTLRSFLSKMVNCQPKRISKRYENTHYNGKHKYEPSAIPMSYLERKKRSERLQEHERRFLRALQRVKTHPDLEDEGDDEDDAEELRFCKKQGALPNLLKKTSSITSGKVAPVAWKEAAVANGARHQFASGDGSRRTSVVGRFQCSLAAGVQQRMDWTGRTSSRPNIAAASYVRDLSLLNTSNTSLSLRSGFASPTLPRKHLIGAGAEGAVGLLMSPLQRTARDRATSAGSTAISGTQGRFVLSRHAEALEDPMMRQALLQQETERAQRLVMNQGSLGALNSQVLPWRKHLGRPHEALNTRRLSVSKRSSEIAPASSPALHDLERRRMSALDHSLARYQRGASQLVPPSRDLMGCVYRADLAAPGADMVSRRRQRRA